MSTRSLFLGLAVLLLAPKNEALRILVAFPMPAKSHSILGHGVVRHLLAAGHEVVHITAFPQGKTVPRLKEISTEIIAKTLMAQSEKMESFKLKNLMGKGNFGDSTMFLLMTYKMHDLFLQVDTVKELLSDPKQTFDAVILEWFFFDAIAGFAPIFQCPLIWFGTTEAHWRILQKVDETPNPAYSLDLMTDLYPPLGFWERVSSMWNLVQKQFLVSFIITPFEKYMQYNPVFGEAAMSRNVKLPAYDDAVYNASLLLLNSHPSYGAPFRLPQNAKYVGGYHVDTDVKPLPEDLQKLMDQAPNGVIYFSMGSNLKSEDMSKEMKHSLLQMFSNLKQTVIWKFEGDMTNVPANVKLVKWAPQPSILAHSNLKFFITHGGQLSTTEAVHFGVPVIGIPILGDQFVNMKSVTSKGFGIMVSASQGLVEALAAAIQEMLSNPKYKSQATELSLIYHDRPVPPGQELVYWVEHVVRTRGAPHLRSPALSLSWYQKMYLDLLVLITIVVYLLFILIKRLRFYLLNKKEEKRKIN